MVCGFESHYAELASLLRNNVWILDRGIMQHSVKTKKISLNDHRFQIYKTFDYVHGNGKYCDSDGGIAFLGLDFSHNHFILKRNCVTGFLCGASRNCIDYRYEHIKEGHLNTGFAGYYCNIPIWGLDISTTSILGFGTSHTDCSPFHGLNHFTHHHRILHSQVDVYYPLKWHDLGPNVALCIDNLKQNGAREWSQDTLRLKSIDGIAGMKWERDSESFYAHLFLGASHDLRKRWSGGTITGIAEDFTRSALDKTQFLATAGIHFRHGESFFINLHYAGRYGKNDKSSTFGITFNKIF
jgi:hypothetical protein